MLRKTILHLFFIGMASSLNAQNHMQKNNTPIIEIVHYSIRKGNMHQVKLHLKNINNVNTIHGEPTYFLKSAITAYLDKKEYAYEIIEYLLSRQVEIVYQSPDFWIREYPLLTVIRNDLREILELFIAYQYDINSLSREHGTSLEQALLYNQQSLYDYLKQRVQTH